MRHPGCDQTTEQSDDRGSDAHAHDRVDQRDDRRSETAQREEQNDDGRQQAQTFAGRRLAAGEQLTHGAAHGDLTLGADCVAVSRMFWAVLFAQLRVGDLDLEDRDLFVLGQQIGFLAGPVTDRTPVTCFNWSRVLATIALPSPVSRSVWQPSTTGWAPVEAPVNARDSSVWPTAESVPSRLISRTPAAGDGCSGR